MIGESMIASKILIM